MIDYIINSPKSFLLMVCAGLITIILTAAGAFVLVLLKKAIKKIGIETEEEIFKSAENIIYNIVNFYNQKVVDDLKKQCDGSLTDEQKDEILFKVKSLVNEVLTSEQLKVIRNKYDDNVNDIDGLEYIIESIVRDLK